MQFALVQSHAFGRIHLLSLKRWIRPVDTRGTSRAVLEAIVDRTCSTFSANPYRVIIGIDPSLMGDWLAPAPANYVAAKRQLLRKRPPSCYFDYLGGSFFGGRASKVWNDMLTRRARYFVTVDPCVYPVPRQVYNRALNARNFPMVLRNVQESGLFETEPALREDHGIWIFRRSADR
jgi:hypothetical protein